MIERVLFLDRRSGQRLEFRYHNRFRLDNRLRRLFSRVIGQQLFYIFGVKLCRQCSRTGCYCRGGNCRGSRRRGRFRSLRRYRRNRLQGRVTFFQLLDLSFTLSRSHQLALMRGVGFVIALFSIDFHQLEANIIARRVVLDRFLEQFDRLIHAPVSNMDLGLHQRVSRTLASSGGSGSSTCAHTDIGRRHVKPVEAGLRCVHVHV
ncbi:hypothetical protein KPSA3_05198 [Pseudomonas syringae pv. actinidiae]|uniref:Uncharacterized protein n=1 Tax=Pseudomonas syringae pv. actinidiae TaxID=103796 RepID=A0AAN4Q8D4_PSESF|nr:hypothetical protein KPSA3_05198 [Pseudomonas syringae pv. actinidiae]